MKNKLTFYPFKKIILIIISKLRTRSHAIQGVYHIIGRIITTLSIIHDPEISIVFINTNDQIITFTFVIW